MIFVLNKNIYITKTVKNNKQKNELPFKIARFY